MPANLHSAVLQVLARTPVLNEATLRPPRSRRERAMVRRLLHWAFDAFNRRDLDAAFALLPRNFEWEFLPEFPGLDVARSRADVRRFLDDFLTDFPAYNTHIENYSDDGQRIVLGVHAFNPGPHTGIEMNIRFVQTWDYEDGVHRIRERLTWAASGLTELIDPHPGAGREAASGAADRDRVE